LLKLNGEPFESEVTGSKIETVNPAPPIKDPSRCEIALASDGGLVPQGNPDGLASKANGRWATYELDTFLPETFDSSNYEIMHTGYFIHEVIENPNRLIPVDAIRDLVKAGKIGKLHNSFFSTSGGISAPRRCDEMGDEIGAEIKKRGIHAVILTST
jgi:glycine/betaine/sarcosine/D-proline reductase family selenoprotein B